PSTIASYPLKHPSVTTPESRIRPVFQFTVPYSSATSERSPGVTGDTAQRVFTFQIGLAVSIRLPSGSSVTATCPPTGPLTRPLQRLLRWSSWLTPANSPAKPRDRPFAPAAHTERPAASAAAGAAIVPWGVADEVTSSAASAPMTA